MKKRSIRKTLPTLATLMMVLFLVLLFPVSMGVQSLIQHKNQADSARELFGQFEHLVETNAADIENEKHVFKERCLSACEAVAFCIDRDPSLIYDRASTRMLAEKLSIDEIHYFTPQGVIFAGTHPEYLGYSVYSGEQMKFFLPMLEDRTLKMCQGIMPNTALGKQMQYAAVWSTDGSMIVQIGMEPKRLLQRMEEKSLKNLFAKIPLDCGGLFHVVDQRTETIILSSNEKVIGLHVPVESLMKPGETFNTAHQDYKGQCNCVYSEVYEDYILVRSYPSKELLSAILETSLLSMLYVLLGGAIIIAIIRRFLNKRIINNINRINKELRNIENGDLNRIALVTYVEELDEMLFYINQMLGNIRSNWEKLNYILDKGHIPIGIYERNNFFHKAVLNERLLEILGVDAKAVLTEEARLHVVENLLAALEQQVIDNDEKIYEYVVNGETRYLRMEKQSDDEGVRYYVTDMTVWWSEIQQAKALGDVDEMTGLNNRRGFSEQLEELFGMPQGLGYAAMILLDADKLKEVNDCVGHYAGDEYLKMIASGISQVTALPTVCARLGGDEFVVFVHHAESRAALQAVVQAISRLRGQAFGLYEFSCVRTIEFSMGVAYYPQDGEDYHVMLRIADERMYQEKLERKKHLL